MSPSRSRAASEAVRALGLRLAAAGALVVALVSLLQHAPLWRACLHGGVTLVILTFGTRLGTVALARAIDCDQAQAASKKGAGPR